MDPVQKLWYFNQWIGDLKDEAELAKNHAYLLASFSHPEEVKRLIGQGDVYISTDEEFEESSRLVREANLRLQQQKEEKRGRRRRRMTVEKPK
jgi:hypothetical protein